MSEWAGMFLDLFTAPNYDRIWALLNFESEINQWIGFRDHLQETPFLMGKSMVSGSDFPNKTNPLNQSILDGSRGGIQWSNSGW